MSGAQDSDAEKSLEPTQRRLEEMRRDGDIAKSAELTSAAALAGFALIFAVGGAALAMHIGAMGTTLLGQADRLAPRLLVGSSALTQDLLGQLALILLPVFGLPLVLILASAFGQRGLAVVPSRLAPRWSRISPLSGAKAHFGREGLVAFLRNLAKAAAVLLALALVVWPALPDLLARHDLSGAAAGLWMVELAQQLLMSAAGLAVLFGGLDFGWQWWLHRQRAMMTREEMKSEMKDSEGDPHLKSHRRQRAQDIALNSMLADVKGADVVVVNPTHYAVALKWKRSDKRPPLVVAKGVDEIAARIRERAAEAGVPIFSDPPTARALHATVDIGKTIRPDHYKAVAAAIRFAEVMRRRAKGLTHGR